MGLSFSPPNLSVPKGFQGRSHQYTYIDIIYFSRAKTPASNSETNSGGRSLTVHTPTNMVGQLAMILKVTNIFLSIYLSIYLSIFLPIFLSIYLFFYLSISVYLSLHLYIFLPIFLTYLSIYLSFCLSIFFLYIYLSIT